MRRATLAIATLLVMRQGAMPACAGQVPLQKGPASPCTAVLDLGVASPAPRLKANGHPFDHEPWDLRCTDGDPGCDADGLADGECQLSVRICVAQPMSRCRPDSILGLRFSARQPLRPSGYRPSLPGVSSGAAGCGEAGSFALSLVSSKHRPSRRGRAKLVVKTANRDGGEAYSSTARVFVQCFPRGASASGAFVD